MNILVRHIIQISLISTFLFCSLLISQEASPDQKEFDRIIQDVRGVPEGIMAEAEKLSEAMKELELFIYNCKAFVFPIPLIFIKPRNMHTIIYQNKRVIIVSFIRFN